MKILTLALYSLLNLSDYFHIFCENISKPLRYKIFMKCLHGQKKIGSQNVSSQNAEKCNTMKLNFRRTFVMGSEDFDAPMPFPTNCNDVLQWWQL